VTRPAGELRRHGLRVHLGPYEARVLDLEAAAPAGGKPPSATPRIETFQSVATEVLARSPRLGRTRLVAVDGPGGAGKSDLARRLAAALGSAPVVRTDDFASWDDPTGWWPRLEAEVLEPLARGEPARFRPYDWVARRLGRRYRVVRPVPVVVLEGVTAARRAVSDRLTFAVWVETPRARRLQRGLERDGEGMRAQWSAWMAEEDRFYADDPVPERADLVVDGEPSLPHDPKRELVRLR
jgi:uridine kinase